MINGRTKVCCLIGKPVRHSLSPVIHNAAFKELNLNYVYVAFNVERDSLKAAINGIRSLGIRGANVTMPYKTEVIEYLDIIDDNAREIGAVNTIVNDNGVLKGYNTDGIGALRAIKRFTSIEGRKILLIGAGGAGRAIATELSKYASELVILNRTVSKATEIALKLSKKGYKVRGEALSRRNIEREIRKVDLIINATPIGMKGVISGSPVPKELLSPDIVVFDIVYEPLETELLQYAKSMGCLTIDGLWMLIYQAAEAFKLWTNKEVPVEVMRKAALEVLERREKRGEERHFQP